MRTAAETIYPPAPAGRLAAASGPDALARAALTYLSKGVAILGPTGAIDYQNPCFARVLGASQPNLDLVLEAAGENARRETALPDGRTVCVESRRIPEGMLLVLDDVTAQAEARSAAWAAGRQDPLTGLPNRLGFGERLQEALPNLASGRGRAALLCLNLDRFKTVNDTLGRRVGDALLRTVADRIRGAVREHDVVARLAGDEFAILQRNEEQPQAASTLAGRLTDLVGRSYIVDGNLLNIGASVGIALVPEDGTDMEALLKSADVALLRAKQEGSGTVRFFETDMDRAMQARRVLELDLRRVLALRELQLAYQPQYNLAARRIKGFEALLRWKHPTRGMVSPAEFIPLAEEIGLIVPMGEWVMRTACREAAGWPDDLSVAVNVSPLQVKDPNLVGCVLSALAESGLPAGRLELEITESVLLEDNGAALDLLNRLHAIGVRVSMDDFGTGYSSLGYLRRFPFDKIKIDQSFIRGSEGDASATAIVCAVAALGRSLGMSTTAEGVETREQLDQVARCGCTDVQGYLISRPMPPGDVPAFLRAGVPGLAEAAGTGEPEARGSSAADNGG